MEDQQRDEVESLAQTVRRDFASAAGAKLLGVAALLTWMAFQWGFGNDALLPSIVAWSFDSVDDGESWSSGIAAVLAATAAGFVFWGATQALDAVITLSGVRLIPNTIRRISRFLNRKGWVTPYAQMRWRTRWAIAYATGVSALSLVDLFATGENGVRPRKRMIIEGTLLSAGSVAVVVALVSTLAMIAKRVPSTEAGAETAIRIAKNPFTWIGLFATIFLIGYLKDRRSAPDPHGEAPMPSG